MRDNGLVKKMVMIANVEFNCLTNVGAVGVVSERIAERRYGDPISVFTPNTEQLIQAVEEPGFLEVLDAADVRVPDSIGIVGADWWRAFVTGKAWRVRERVAGVDLAESLLAQASMNGWKVALIGGVGNASEVAVQNLKKRFSGLNIWHIPVGKIEVRSWKLEAGSNNKIDLIMENESEIIGKINEIRPDLVLVGLGAPKQEVWVLKYGKKLRAQVVMVVGGAIDMWSGVQARSPRWMRQWGLEWLWRLIQQPQRIGRQLRLVKFGWMAITGRV